MQLAQLGTLAAVALALGLFVVRPILTGARPAQGALPAPDGQADPAAALTGEIAGDGLEGPAMNTVSDFDFDLGTGDGLPGFAGDADDPVARLKTLIDERQEETLEILQSWMNDGKERA
jgi:flagellar M-ring protein FliF